YFYDRDGREKQRLADGQLLTNTTQWDYDDTGRLKKTTHPDGSFESFSYNLDDTLDVHLMRSGIQVKNIYSPANLLFQSKFLVPSPIGPRILLADGGDCFGYDVAGRLTTAERPSSLDPYVSVDQYDLASRPTQERVGVRTALARGYDTWSREET